MRRRPIILFLALFSVISEIASPSTGWSKDSPKRKAPNDARNLAQVQRAKIPPKLVGYEVELEPRVLSRLLRYFDLEQLATKIRRQNLTSFWTDDLLENYVLNAEARAALPETMQRALTQGLRLDAAIPEVGRVEAPRLTHESPALVTGQKLIAPSESGYDRVGSLYVPRESSAAIPKELRQIQMTIAEQEAALSRASVKRAAGVVRPDDWRELRRRWNAIPIQERIRVAQFRYLSDLDKAEVITRLPVSGKDAVGLAYWLKLKSDAPDFLKGLTLTLDGPHARRSVEVALSVPAKSARAAFASLDAILEATGQREYFLSPGRQKRGGSAVHVHVTVPEPLRGSLDTTLELFRKKLLIDLLAAGPQNDAVLTPLSPHLFLTEGVPQNLYEHSLYDKGLLRSFGPSDQGHFELREFVDSPEATLEELMGYLRMDEGDARKAMQTAMEHTLRLKPEIAERIYQKNPWVMLDFEGAFDPGVVRARVLEEVENHFRSGNQKFARHQIRKWIEAKPTAETLDTIAQLAQRLPSLEVLTTPDLMAVHSPAEQRLSLEKFRSHPERVNSSIARSLFDWSTDQTDLEWITRRIIENLESTQGDAQRLAVYDAEQLLMTRLNTRHPLRARAVLDAVEKNYAGGKYSGAAEVLAYYALDQYRPAAAHVNAEKVRGWLKEFAFRGGMDVQDVVYRAAVHEKVLKPASIYFLMAVCIEARDFTDLLTTAERDPQAFRRMLDGLWQYRGIDPETLVEGLERASRRLPPAARTPVIQELMNYLIEKNPAPTLPGATRAQAAIPAPCESRSQTSNDELIRRLFR